MGTSAVIAIVALPGCLVSLILTLRSIRLMRSGDEEWRQRWRQLDPQRRNSIRERMKQGEAVLDPEDAELALRAVAQVDYVRKSMAPMTRAAMLLVVVWLVVGVVSGSTVLIVIGAFGLLSSGVLDLLARRQRQRHHVSAVATRRLHDMDPQPL